MPPLLTAAQIASRLQMSPWSIYQGVKAGSIPARRLNARGRLRFVESEVMDALKPANARLRELAEKAEASLRAA